MPRSDAATSVKQTPNTMSASATNASPMRAVAGGLVTSKPNASINPRPVDMNGLSARPWRNPSPITAPIVPAAATIPTLIPVPIRAALIARKETRVADPLKGARDARRSVVSEA